MLFPHAYTLNCYVCPSSSSTCPQKQCPAEKSQCAAVRLTFYQGISKVDSLSKFCLPPQECIKGSMNLGVDRIVYTTECCNTNLCNKNNAEEPTKAKANGKKCHSCDGNGDCKSIMFCEGSEELCVKATVTSEGKNKTVKGCATRNMCSSDSKVSVQELSSVSCCEGNLCNSAEGASTSFMLLAAVLISICFFSN